MALKSHFIKSLPPQILSTKLRENKTNPTQNKKGEQKFAPLF